jgi:hypothetical protein
MASSTPSESHWSKALRVARDSSNTQWDGAFENSAAMNDFAVAVTDAYATLNLDQRDIAIGGDYEMTKFEMFKTAPENWENVMWGAHIITVMISQLMDRTNPKTLVDSLFPINPYLDWLEGPTPTRECTVLNSHNLHDWEEFGLTLPDVTNNYSDIRYAVMDMQDLLDGEGAGTFDMVRVGPPTWHSINTRVIDALMGLVNVGGVLHFTNPSNLQSAYNVGTPHRHPYTSFNRHIAAQANFDVYHIPMEQGMIIAKRLS